MALTIIADRERVNMVTGWTEFLCLATGNTKKFIIFTGRYQNLGPSSIYRDPETGDYVLPDEIEDATVVSTEDDWVVGGELNWYNTDDMIEFDDFDEDNVQIWLVTSGWEGTFEAVAISAALQRAV